MKYKNSLEVNLIVSNAILEQVDFFDKDDVLDWIKSNEKYHKLLEIFTEEELLLWIEKKIHVLHKASILSYTGFSYEVNN